MLLRHTTQMVEVGNQKVSTQRGSLSIRWGRSSRAGDIEMMLHPDAQPDGFAVSLGDPIRVLLQERDGQTLDIRGKVTHAARVRSGDVSLYRLGGRTEEGVARDYAVLAEWENVSASEIIEEAWTRAGVQYIDLSGISEGAPVVERYSSPYNSLYQVMEDISGRIGWAWRIRHGVLYFFDPLIVSGHDLDQSESHIESGTLEASEDLDSVRNIVRTQAYEHANFSVSRLVRAGECVREIAKPDELRGDEWQMRNQPVAFLSGGESGVVSVAEDTETYQLRQPVRAGTEPVHIYLNLPVRRPVWMRRQSDTSITLFGPRAGMPQLGAGDMEMGEAQQALDTYLHQHAYPSITVKCGVLRLLWEPDTVSQVRLTDPAIDRPMYVTDIRITSDDADLACSIQLATPEDVLASTGRGDPAHEAFRRLERMERSGWTMGARGGLAAQQIGDLRGRGRVRGNWAWSGTAYPVRPASVSGTWAWSGRFDLPLVVGNWTWSGTADPVNLASVAGTWAWSGTAYPVRPASVAGTWTWSGRFDLNGKRVVRPRAYVLNTKRVVRPRAYVIP